MQEKAVFKDETGHRHLKAAEVNKLTHLGCWDHARRKFKDAEQVQAKGKKVKASKADRALLRNKQSLPYT